MKVATAQIAGIVQKPPASLRAILVFGPDAGLVSERASLLAKKIVADINDPFSTTLLTGAQLNDPPSRLYDEMASEPFGGGRRLVRLQQAIDSNSSIIAALTKDWPKGSSLLLVEAGDLDKRSKLRACFETDAPEVCALPCYIEDSGQRQRTLGDYFQKAGFKIDRPLLAHLSDLLPPDRLAMQSEVDKLCLYCAGQKEITNHDILAVIGDAGAAEADDLFLLASLGQAEKALALFDRMMLEQNSVVSLLRAGQRHFIRLHKIRALMDGGLSAREAVDKMQPKVFWKHVAPLTQIAQRWSLYQIEEVLNHFYAAEADTKKTGTPDVSLTGALILKISEKIF